MINISDLDLLRLYDCATSSRYGMADKGFPMTFARLEPMGLVRKEAGGYVVTTLGSEYVKANKERLFLKKKKVKKSKTRDWEDDDNTE